MVRLPVTDVSLLGAKAEALRALHTSGKLLVLTNVWDPIGARIVEAAGFPAVATASAAISASLGYADGEIITRSTMIAAVARIARSVDVPVTADMERGYGDTLDDVRDTIRELIAVGAVGLNIEDSVGVEGELRPAEEQCERIAAVREVAAEEGVPLVINARTDPFVRPGREPAEQLEEAVRRAGAYAAAGADCIYPIGPGDRATVTALRARIHTPINILASPRAMPLAELEAAGVNRVSFGPYLFRACLKRFEGMVAQLSAFGSYDCFARDFMSSDDVHAFLRAEPEVADAG